MSSNLVDIKLQVAGIFDDAKRRALELLEGAESESDPLLTVEEVAAILKVSERKVYDMRKDGRLPESKDIGGKDRYRWLLSAVTAYVGGDSIRGRSTNPTTEDTTHGTDRRKG